MQDNFTFYFLNKSSSLMHNRKPALVYKYSFATEESKANNAESKDEDSQLLNTTYTYGCVFSNSGKLLATFSDGKDLVVLRTEDWLLIGKRCLILLDCHIYLLK